METPPGLRFCYYLVMKTLQDYNSDYRKALFKNLILTDQDKSALLSLDKEYGKLCELLRG